MPRDNPNHQPIPTTILLLTHPRTGSHVLERMLSTQPNTLYGAEWFVTSRITRREVLSAGPIHQVDTNLQVKLHKELAEAFTRFTAFLDDAERQDMTAFANAQPHTMMNPEFVSDRVYETTTSDAAAASERWVVGHDWCEQRGFATECTSCLVIPDAVLLRPGTVPILNVRHPMLCFESIYRGLTALPTAKAEGELLRQLMITGLTFHWQRAIYDWYAKHGGQVGIHPVVLDADDYLGPQKEEVMRRLCEVVPGLDADSILYSWAKATEDEVKAMPDLLQEVHQTLLSSSGVLPGYVSEGRDIETEMKKWIESHGIEQAELLREFVDRGMPDYKYLRERRLKP